ncbi:MAG: hypothetical protein GQ553_01530 [Nitrosomonadaceae bacterium]|nr:hypothetical protein [Nitrosomonadaceae bacterium]
MADIESSHMSMRSVAILLFFACSMTASAVVAWMTVVHANERVEYINGRLDTKTGRNAKDIKDLESRVIKLELPSSDNTDSE